MRFHLAIHDLHVQVLYKSCLYLMWWYNYRVLLKICNCLKNRDRDVRDAARHTLLKMTQSLGVKYFPYIVKEMKQALTKGYQVGFTPKG